MKRTRHRRLLRGLLLAAGVLLLPPVLLFVLLAASTLPPLPLSPRTPLRLSGVTLLNPGEPRRAGVTIEIADGRITAISDSPGGPAPKQGGGYVLPGLIDAHVHSPLLPGERPLWDTLYLLHGVTAVRNLGDGGRSLRLKQAGPLQKAGPRLFSCGVHLDGPGGGFPARIVATPQAARAAVRELAAAGADCIKVMPHLSPPVFAALREAARVAGLPVVGHMVNAYGTDGLEQSGIADVQHLTGVPESPSPGFSDDEWRSFRRGFDTLPAGRIDKEVEISRRLGITHTPTLVGAAYEAGEPGFPWRLDLLPPYYQSMWTALDRARTQEDRDQSRRNLPRYLDVVQRLHRAGVSVQAGSDVFPFIPGVVPGAGLHDELRLLVRAGFRPEEALFAATTVPGRMLPGPRLGSLRVGGPADLLVFRADPTASLANLATLDVVVVDGRRYLREALSAHLRVQLDASRRFPFSFSARLLGWLISVVA